MNKPEFSSLTFLQRFVLKFEKIEGEHRTLNYFLVCVIIFISSTLISFMYMVEGLLLCPLLRFLNDLKDWNF